MSDTSIWLINRKVMRSNSSLSSFHKQLYVSNAKHTSSRCGTLQLASFPGRLDVEVSVEMVIFFMFFITFLKVYDDSTYPH